MGRLQEAKGGWWGRKGATSGPELAATEPDSSASSCAVPPVHAFARVDYIPAPPILPQHAHYFPNDNDDNDDNDDYEEEYETIELDPTSPEAAKKHAKDWKQAHQRRRRSSQRRSSVGQQQNTDFSKSVLEQKNRMGFFSKLRQSRQTAALAPPPSPTADEQASKASDEEAPKVDEVDSIHESHSEQATMARLVKNEPTVHAIPMGITTIRKNLYEDDNPGPMKKRELNDKMEGTTPRYPRYLVGLSVIVLLVGIILISIATKTKGDGERVVVVSTPSPSMEMIAMQVPAVSEAPTTLPPSLAPTFHPTTVSPTTASPTKSPGPTTTTKFPTTSPTTAFPTSAFPTPLPTIAASTLLPTRTTSMSPTFPLVTQAIQPSCSLCFGVGVLMKPDTVVGTDQMTCRELADMLWEEGTDSSACWVYQNLGWTTCGCTTRPPFSTQSILFPHLQEQEEEEEEEEALAELVLRETAPTVSPIGMGASEVPPQAQPKMAMGPGEPTMAPTSSVAPTEAPSDRPSMPPTSSQAPSSKPTMRYCPLCADGSAVPEARRSEIALQSRGGLAAGGWEDVSCGGLETFLDTATSDVVEEEECLSLQVIGRIQCGCPVVPPETPCWLCPQGQVSPHLDLVLGFVKESVEWTCRDVMVETSRITDADECRAVQAAGAPVCGCA